MYNHKKFKSVYLIFILLTISFSYAFGQELRGAVPVEVENTKTANSFAFIIGISDYKNVPDLYYADKDALSFRDFWLKTNPNQKDSNHLEIFLNQDATRINITDALSGFLRKVKKGDKVFFFFAGHGDIEDLSQSSNGLLLLYDSPAKDYFGLTDGVLQVNQIAEYFGKLSTIGAEVIYIIDACHSGKLIGGMKGRSQTNNAIQNTLGNESTLMLSCESYQLSMEGIEWGGGRGVFSYYLEEGLYGLADLDNDHNISLLELDSYVKRKTYLASEKTQTPVFRGGQNQILNIVSQTLKDSILKHKENAQTEYCLINYKGDEYNYLLPNDTTSYKLLKKFNSILESNTFRDSTSTAYQDYRQFISLNPNNYLNSILRRKLITKGDSKFDSLVRPIIAGKKLKWKKECIVDALSEIDSCLSLIDENNYLQSHLLSRKYYLESLLCSFGIDINTYGPLNEHSMQSCINLLHKARALEPNAAYIYFSLGRSHQLMMNTDSSLSYLKKFSNLIPNSALAHNLLGIYYGDKKWNTESIQEFNKALELDPGFKEAYANLAAMYIEIKDYSSAIRSARSAIAISPKFIGGYNNLAGIYLEMKSYKEVIKIMDDALEMDSTNLSSMLLKGLAYYYLNEFNVSVEIFQKIISLKKDYVYAYKNLGVCYKSLGEYQLAIQTLEKYLVFDTTSSKFYLEIAHCYNLMNNQDSADIYFRKAAHFASKRMDSNLLLADIYNYGFKDRESAMVYYDKGLVEDSLNSKALTKAITNALALHHMDKAQQYKNILEHLPYSNSDLSFVELALSINDGNIHNLKAPLSKVIQSNHEFKWQILEDPFFEKILSDPELAALLN